MRNDKTTVAEKIGKGLKKITGMLAAQREKIKNKEAESSIQRTGQISGVVLLYFLENFTKIFNFVLAKNAVIVGLEKGYKKALSSEKNDANKFSKFLKANPWLLSYLTYYLLLIGASKASASEVEKLYEKLEFKKEIKNNEAKYISPETTNYEEEALKEYGAEILIGLTELETYRNKPKKHSAESRYTNGLGMTWEYKKIGNKIIRYENTGKTKAKTKEENYKQVELHLVYETLKNMKINMKGKYNFSREEIVALALAGYQRPADIKRIVNELEKAKTKEEKANAFLAGVKNVNKKWREGTIKRRWFCALYATGYINIEDILSMDRDVFAKTHIKDIYKSQRRNFSNGSFIINEENVIRLKKLKNVNNTVAEFLSDFDRGQEILSDVNYIPSLFEEEFVKAKEDFAKASVLINEGKYNKAIRILEDLIKDNPKNMELYSSLSLAYVKSADDAKSNKRKIKLYEKALEIVSDNSELFSEYVKCSAFYNAGCAREAIGKIYLEEGEKDFAQNSFDKAIKNYQIARRQAEKLKDKGKIALYDKCASEVKKYMKKNLLVKATKNIKSAVDAQNKGIELYGLVSKDRIA